MARFPLSKVTECHYLSGDRLIYTPNICKTKGAGKVQVREADGRILIFAPHLVIMYKDEIGLLDVTIPTVSQAS
jgi:hypothetical protein